MKIILIIITSIVLLGTAFGVVDYNRIKNNKMPIFMVRITSASESKLDYIGLGYRMERFTGVSYTEPLISDNYVKFGLWFYIWEVEDIKK